MSECIEVGDKAARNSGGVPSSDKAGVLFVEKCAWAKRIEAGDAGGAVCRRCLSISIITRLSQEKKTYVPASAHARIKSNKLYYDAPNCQFGTGPSVRCWVDLKNGRMTFPS